MNPSRISRHAALFCALALAFTRIQSAPAAEAPPLRVLFLGDTAAHKPADRFKQLEPVLTGHHVEIEYTQSLSDLNAAKLAGYDCLVIYANWTKIAPEQEQALLDFVARGGGFVPIHCASYCFLNSPKYIELVGAQFKSHGTGVFQETIIHPDHPVFQGVSPIESWDESYVHTLHNTNRLVLSERRDANHAEPYTWVREHGKGRVFYTAWGHDQRTWSNTNFQALVENGIRWASANSPAHLQPRTGLPRFEYVESPAPLPHYIPNTAWGSQGEAIHTMQKSLSPEESMKHLVTQPGFEVKLFASEPDIAKPIWMAWDERGRLWIAETFDYPNNMQRDGEGHDRILICEDTDGDGKADKFTVFADKLSVPTSFTFANGGIIVVHSGRTEFFKDTDGDDVADVRQVLFRGWGTGDTHAGPSNLHYGFDNWIWGTVGYSGFNGMVGGKSLRFSQGIYRFKADGSKLEFIRSSNNNTWGLGLTEDNLVFGSTANGNASMYMPIPNRYYEAVNGWSASRMETIADSQRFFPITEKIRQVDWFGKYTAGAGSAIYTARNFPKEYWNRCQFVAEPTGHLLGQFFPEAVGADFVAHNARSFAASDDEWTAPICAEVGPEGSLWLIDWYNYVIQHNPTPRGFSTGKGGAYETPLRDQTHGRIYRITYKDGKPGQTANLAKATPQQLVETLKNDNMFWRVTAQRLLVTRGQKDVAPALCALARDTSTDEIGLNPAAIHALWTLEGLGAFAEGSQDSEAVSAAVGALKHPSAGVRRAALMVLPRDASALTAILDAKLLEDSQPQVRLAALLALAEMPASDLAATAVIAMLKLPANSDDRWISDAATCAAARHDAGFLRSVLASSKSAAGEKPAANLLPNASFENEAGGKPAGWRTAVSAGKAELAISSAGRMGGRSLQIGSTEGGASSWQATVPVQPRTDYRLSGWIKTAGLNKIETTARGAALAIRELSESDAINTRPMIGDNDWTHVEVRFNSGQLREVNVMCFVGNSGRTQGTAWFDSLELVPASLATSPGDISKIVQRVTTHYAERGPVESILPTLSALNGASPVTALPVLDGLVAGWPQGKSPALGDSDTAMLKSLLQSLPESSRDRLLLLAQRWDRTDIFGSSIDAIIDSLKTLIADGAAGDDQRVSAAKRLLVLKDKAEIVEKILAQVTLLTPPTLATGFIGALTESRNAETGPTLSGHWSQLTPTMRRAAIATLLRRAEWARTLLDAVDKGAISRTDLAPEQWSQLKLNPNRNVARLAERLATSTGAVSADRAEVVQKLLPIAKESGDPARGRNVFTTNCIICHTFNGQGGKVGPDLSGLGARDKGEILIDILDPNRSVEANYRLWNVTTKDGETYAGRLETETQTSVEILDSAGQKHVLERKNVATMQGTQLSIMPTGFESIPPDDLKALLSYLTQAAHP